MNTVAACSKSQIQPLKEPFMVHRDEFPALWNTTTLQRNKNLPNITFTEKLMQTLILGLI